MSNATITDGRFKNHKWFEEVEVNSLRPRLASDIVRLRHTGWYVDDTYGETTQGIVLRLPNNRGFLAGCSDPWNGEAPYCAGLFEMYIYDDENTAARCADQIAEWYDEECREDNEKQREEMRLEDIENERQAMIDNLP